MVDESNVNIAFWKRYCSLWRASGIIYKTKLQKLDVRQYNGFSISKRAFFPVQCHIKLLKVIKGPLIVQLNWSMSRFAITRSLVQFHKLVWQHLKTNLTLSTAPAWPFNWTTVLIYMYGRGIKLLTQVCPLDAAKRVRQMLNIFCCFYLSRWEVIVHNVLNSQHRRCLWVTLIVILSDETLVIKSGFY